MVTTNIYHALGVAERLLARSDYHHVLPLATYMEVEIIPPVIVGQFKIYSDQDGLPEGMVTWAWISEAVEVEVHHTGRSLRSDEWQSGERLFFNDWLSPETGMRRMLRDMTVSRFPGHVATAIRHNPDGTVRKVNRFIGRKVPRVRRRRSVRISLTSSPAAHEKGIQSNPNVVARALAQHLCCRAKSSECGSQKRVRLAVQGAMPLDLILHQEVAVVDGIGTPDTVIEVPLSTAKQFAQAADGVEPWEMEELSATCDIAGDRTLGLKVLETLLAFDPEAERILQSLSKSGPPELEPVHLAYPPHQKRILCALATGQPVIQAGYDTNTDIFEKPWVNAYSSTWIQVPGGKSINTLAAACQTICCETSSTVLSFGLPSRLAKVHPMPVFDLSCALSPRMVLAHTMRNGTIMGPLRRARHSLINVLAGTIDLRLAPSDAIETSSVKNGGQKLDTPLAGQNCITVQLKAGETAVIPAGTCTQAVQRRGPVALITTDLHKL